MQGNRKVSGVLRGFDIFLNLVVDDTTDESKLGEKVHVGTMVRVLDAIESRSETSSVANVYDCRSSEGAQCQA